MASRDYYNVLGLPRDASADDVKRAYRSLARRFHPDLNPGDAVAEQRFKDVHEAYKVLSDPSERARYDRLGPLYVTGGRPPGPDELNGALDRVWSTLFGARQTAGEDLKYTVSVTLEEVATGVHREITVPRQVRCGDCAGEGARPVDRKRCDVCGGTGKASGLPLLRASCYHCDGRGWVPTQPCPTCDGEGRVPREDTLRVRVPPGVATGNRLKVAGRGHEAARAGGKAGDLFVIVNVADHALFARRGADLVATLPLTVLEAAAGADVTVPTLEGSTVIRVPTGTPSGHLFRLAGRGLPRAAAEGGRGRGDLLLEAVVEVPAQLDPAEQTRLAAWMAALPPERHPRRAAFDRAVKERR